MNPATARQPHALYRFLDTSGELLYVGVTNNPSRRFTQHGVSRDWWHEVETIRMERHESREAVLEAERAAIIAERPRYNVKHNGGAPVTNEAPERGVPGDYPVNAGEVVALGLSPNPLGEVQCPVGLVKEVSAFGVKLALFSFWDGTFGHAYRTVPWHRIMEIEFARRVYGDEAADKVWDWDGEVPVYHTIPLGDFQTIWTKGREHWREQKQADAR